MGITTEQLEACIGLAQRTRGMRERIERIRAMAELSGIKSENIGGGGRPLDDGTGEGGSMLADLLETFGAEAREYYKIAWTVEQVVKAAPMSDNQRDVVRYRYIDGMTWPEIATAIQYSERQCHRFEEDAMVMLGIKITESDDSEKDVMECQCQDVL